MAKLKDGMDNGFRGKIDGFVVYELNGQVIKRKIGKRLKPVTLPELANQQSLSLISALLKPVKEFIEIGFELEAKLARKSQHNMACSYNYKNALTGVYPNKYIDYSKVLFSNGKMPATKDVKAYLINHGIEFTWNTDNISNGFKPTDRVLLMAYFPEKKQAVCSIIGAKRKKGVEQLILPLSKKPVIIETYISFIAINYKSISNSIYTGQFIWNPSA
ncbi:DUF6266 family protein [Pedobacter sp. L105]|uniref:DUF6266 family protein n=1 Tax=Pedobacter sp. L105 TaxID=1641871 RepID=UPI00131BB887|nr:DUF6266 family protein [Pedobacter sp. L105]